jgi:hypothetical protein
MQIVMGWAQTALRERTFHRMGSGGRRLVKVASCKSRVSVVHDCSATVMRRVVAQQSGVRRMAQCCGARVTATRLASSGSRLCVVQKLPMRLARVIKPSPEGRPRVVQASAGSCWDTLSQLYLYTIGSIVTLKTMTCDLSRCCPAVGLGPPECVQSGFTTIGYTLKQGIAFCTSGCC